MLPGVRAHVRLAMAAFVAVTAVGCSSAFDRSFNAGRYDEAIRVFAADSALHSQPDALYRAALAYATPDHRAYNPARARDLLASLLQRFPGNSNHREAVALFNLLESSERLERDGVRIESELDGLRQRVIALEQRLAEQEATHIEVATSNAALRDSLDRAQRMLRVREAQMRALQDELRALKEIDLGQIVPDTTGR